MRRLFAAMASVCLALGVHAQPVPSDDVFLGNASEIKLDDTGYSNPCPGDTCSIQDLLDDWDSIVTGGGSGTDIILDLADDASNESTALSEIATTGDTNSIFTEPSADKLKIDLSQNWPTCDAATTATTATTANSLAAGALDAFNEIADLGCSSNQKIGWNGSAWACDNDDDSGGSPAFSAITTGTNTSATMTVGTGASIVSSGSGSIEATDYVDNSITLGTDTTGDYVAGATSSQGLTLTGSEAGTLGVKDCAANQVLKRNSVDTAWDCADDLQLSSSIDNGDIPGLDGFGQGDERTLQWILSWDGLDMYPPNPIVYYVSNDVGGDIAAAGVSGNSGRTKSDPLADWGDVEAIEHEGAVFIFDSKDTFTFGAGEDYDPANIGCDPTDFRVYSRFESTTKGEQAVIDMGGAPTTGIFHVSGGGGPNTIGCTIVVQDLMFTDFTRAALIADDGVRMAAHNVSCVNFTGTSATDCFRASQGSEIQITNSLAESEQKEALFVERSAQMNAVGVHVEMTGLAASGASAVLGSTQATDEALGLSILSSSITMQNHTGGSSGVKLFVGPSANAGSVTYRDARLSIVGADGLNNNPTSSAYEVYLGDCDGGSQVCEDIFYDFVSYQSTVAQCEYAFAAPFVSTADNSSSQNNILIEYMNWECQSTQNSMWYVDNPVMYDGTWQVGALGGTVRDHGGSVSALFRFRESDGTIQSDNDWSGFQGDLVSVGAPVTTVWANVWPSNTTVTFDDADHFNGTCCIDDYDTGGPPETSGNPNGFCDSDGTTLATLACVADPAHAAYEANTGSFYTHEFVGDGITKDGIHYITSLRLEAKHDGARP